jgi:hypothetical protein
MTATRPNTDVPFFYDAPEHASQMAVVDAIKAELEAVSGAVEHYSKTYSDDQLTCTQRWEFGDVTHWQNYMSSINTRLPRGIIDRNLYFLDNGHKLSFTWTDDFGQSGTVVQVA